MGQTLASGYSDSTYNLDYKEIVQVKPSYVLYKNYISYSILMI